MSEKVVFCSGTSVMIAFKRFTNSGDKICTRVAFPGGTIQIGKGITYKVSSVIFHRGAILDGGHCYLYQRIKDVWYCNENPLIPIPTEKALLDMEHGYVFYAEKA